MSMDIYMDYAATTPLDPRVAAKMAGFLTLDGVFDVDFTEGLTLVEIAEDVTVDEIKAKTEAPFKVADDLKPML